MEKIALLREDSNLLVGIKKDELFEMILKERTEINN